MKLKKMMHISAALLLSAFAASAAQASVVGVSSLGNFYNSNQGFSQNDIANSFTTGSTGQTLDSVDVLLTVYAGNTADFTATLYTDNGSNRPGTVLGTGGTVSLNAGNNQLVNFDFASQGISLAAGTTYWFALYSSNKDNSLWAKTSDLSETELAGWSIADIHRAISSSGWGTVSPSDVMFAVNVSAVPVPAAAWLFGSDLVGLIGIARLKQMV